MVKVREQGEGLLWEWPVCPDSFEGKMCVSCGLCRRNIPKGDFLKGKTGRGESLEMDGVMEDGDGGAFLGGTNGDTGIP